VKKKKVNHHPIKRWRFENGLTGEEAAEKFGMNKSYLSEIETRKKEPSLSLASKIVRLTKGAVRFEDLVLSK